MKTQLRFGVFLCCFLTTNLVFASFHKHLWIKWTVHNPLSHAVISHQEWQEFLSATVITNKEGITLVDYPHLTPEQLKKLEDYITRMSHIKISEYNRHEQLAYWLNLYNALIVQTIAHYFPIASIQEVGISPGLFSIGPWGANLITISKSQLTLDDIQNRIIRPIWNDPRTHYALNDSTIGAANLNPEPFEGSRIDIQLNQVASQYINSLRAIQLIEQKLVVSKIYDWYIDDFGGNTHALITHFCQYANEPLRSQLKQIHSINSYIYNWHLNSTARSS